MQERVILLILLLICAGQVWAIFRGRLTAVIYYCSVAPLGYFSVWMFATWGPDRLCGILLVAGCLLLYHPVRGVPRFTRHRFALFLAFLVLITIVGSFFWPVEAMAGKSAVYGSLRGAVQIFSWLVLAGAAWQVAIALSQPSDFEKLRKVIIIVGVLHSGYAMYQMVAYSTGLPATGIRRAYEGISAESGGESIAAFSVAGTSVKRPGSLIGEPKGLGVMSLVWIASILSLLMEGRANARLVLALLLSLAALFVTFSTSAWAGLICMMAIAIWAARGQRTSRFASLLLPVLFLIVGFAIVGNSGMLPKGIGLASIIRERTTEREYLADMPEIEATKVLTANPLMFLAGTGLGGMSFFIARNLGGWHVILFPNTGLLAYICNMGLVGIALLMFALWGGIRPTLMSAAGASATTRSLSFIGTVCLIQTFIFDAGITLFALAFLLAADWRRRSVTLSLGDVRVRKRYAHPALAVRPARKNTWPTATRRRRAKQ